VDAEDSATVAPTSSSPLTPPPEFEDHEGGKAEEPLSQDILELPGPAKMNCSFETVYESQPSQDEGIKPMHSHRLQSVQGPSNHCQSNAQSDAGNGRGQDELHQAKIRDVFRALRSLSRDSRFSDDSSIEDAEVVVLDDVSETSLDVLVDANIEKTDGPLSALSPASPVLMPNADPPSTQSLFQKICAWDTVDQHTPDNSPLLDRRKLSASSPSRQPRLGTSSFLYDPDDCSPPPVTVQTRVITLAEPSRRKSLLDRLSKSCEDLPEILPPLPSTNLPVVTNRPSHPSPMMRSRLPVHPMFARSSRSTRSRCSSLSSLRSLTSTGSLTAPPHSPPEGNGHPGSELRSFIHDLLAI
jgi:hypothetical protein